MKGRDDEDELPDAVVRMYRDSLDEDGLDFLRRGPRTLAERLAYMPSACIRRPIALPGRRRTVRRRLCGNSAAWTAGGTSSAPMRATGLPEALPVKAMATLAHEMTHAWQDQLGDRWVSGALAADDPDYRLGELAALAYPFFLPFGSVPRKRYSGQVLEMWSRKAEDQFFGELWKRLPPVLDSPPAGYGLP